jgi:hypothetical protein
MPTARPCIAVLALLLTSACAGPSPVAGTAPVAGSAAPAASATASASAAPTPAPPDGARIYAGLLGRTEDFPRVVRAPKEYDGRSIVLYGVRAGDLKPFDARFSMPFASVDGRTTIAAVDRPPPNQLYLVMADDFARDARERRLLTGGASRGPVFVECRVAAQAAGNSTSYACEIDKIVAIANDRVVESLWRGRGGALEWYRY